MSRPAPSIADFMTPGPHSIGRDQSLAAAHRLMREHRIRHLPVLDGGKLVGVISDRDLHLAETLKDVDAERVPVEDAMTPSPYWVGPATPLAVVAREMAEQKIGSAVVIDGKRIAGVFTVTDALRALADYAEGKLAVETGPSGQSVRPRPSERQRASKPARGASRGST
jgi:acetoin utilization protein AcuB